MPQMDILVSLSAQDRASGAVNKVTQSLHNLEAAAQRQGTALSQVQTKIGALATGLGQLNTAIVGAATALAGIEIVRMASQFIQVGEAVRQTRMMFEHLAGGTDAAADALELLRKATRGLVSDFELMEGATKLMRSGLAGSVEEAAHLIGLANDLGANLDQLFSALANQSYEVLDSFGVSSGAVRQLAQELRASGMDMETAFKTAFIRIAEESRARLEPALERSKSHIRELGALINNVTNAMAEGVASVVDQGLKAGFELAFILQHTDILAQQTIRDISIRLQQAGILQPGQYLAFEPTKQELLPPERAERLVAPMDALREAINEQRAATEQNTQALLDQARSINDQIARMLGWTPPEQRALEGAERSVRDALRRAGLSQEQMDEVMLLGQRLLPAFLQAGLSPAEAAMRAYGIFDPTPGQGREARFVGQDITGLPLAEGLPTQFFAMPQMAMMGAAERAVEDLRRRERREEGDFPAPPPPDQMAEAASATETFVEAVGSLNVAAETFAQTIRDAQTALSQLLGQTTPETPTVAPATFPQVPPPQLMPFLGQQVAPATFPQAPPPQLAPFLGQQVAPATFPQVPPPQLAPFLGQQVAPATFPQVPPPQFSAPIAEATAEGIASALRAPQFREHILSQLALELGAQLMPRDFLMAGQEMLGGAGLQGALGAPTAPTLDFFGAAGGALDLGTVQVHMQDIESAASETSFHFDAIVQDTNDLTASAQAVLAPNALGGWEANVNAAQNSVQSLTQHIQALSSVTHPLTFEVELNQRSRDRLSQWVFEILRSSGVQMAAEGLR